MNQTGTIVLIAFIAAYMIFWGVIICVGIPREERTKQRQRFDERQKVEQGRACQYAYITLLCYLFLYLLLDHVLHIVWCDTAFGILLGIAFSVSVFLAYCVFQDAYFGIGASKPGVLIGVNAVGVTQLVMGIESVEDGAIIQNGIITGNASHFVFLALIILLDVFVFIRKRMDRR